MDWNKLADEKILGKTLKALKERGVEVMMVNDRKEALEKIKELIPNGAEVMNGSSTTLGEIGFVDYLKSGKHGWNNLRRKRPAKTGGATNEIHFSRVLLR